MKFRTIATALRARLADRQEEPDPQLDLDFYRRSNPDLRGLSDAKLARHYRVFGRPEGRLANPAQAVELLERQFGALPPDFEPEEYLAANPDVRRLIADPLSATEHYLRYGKPEKRKHFPFDPDLYRALYFPEEEISDRQLEAHYEAFGRREGWIASGRALMRARGLPGGAWVDRLKLADFALLNWSWAGEIRNKLEAVDAIIAHGAEHLAPLSFEVRFEPGYYRETHPGLAADPDAALYRDWLFRGMEEAEPASAAEHLASLGLELSSYPDAFDWSAYARARKLRGAHRWSSLDDLLTEGPLKHGPVPLAGVEAAGFLSALSRSQVFRNEPAAIRLAEQARRAGPATGALLQQLADSYYRQKRWAEAAHLYMEVALTDEANFWTFCNGARASLNAGEVDAALDLLFIGKDRVAGEPLFREVVREVVEAEFGLAMRRAIGLCLEGERAGAERLLDDAIGAASRRWGALDPLGARIEPGPEPRVVIFANTDLPQCTHYRVEQKAELLESLNIEFQVFSMSELEDFLSALAGAAAAIFYRVAATPSNLRAIEVAREMGVPTYYEIDDLIFSESYPEPYETYGGSITPQTYAQLQVGAPLFRAAMVRCDYGIASTTALAEHMRPLVLTGRVFVLPNGIDSRNARLLRAPPGRMRRDKDILIFYGSGTKAHNSDFLELAAPALADIMTRRPDVRLMIVGYLALDHQLERFRDRITRVDFVPDAQAFWSLLAEADINLAVLKPTEVTDAKSEIKWLEAAVLSIPSVVSGTARYREVLEDGVDVLIANQAADWTTALNALVSNPSLRKRIGRAAHRRAAESYSLRANARRLQAALQPAFDRAEAATRFLPPKKPRILLVNVFFPPQTIGGATRVVRDNIDYFLSEADGRFDFAVVTTDNGVPQSGGLRVESYSGAPVFRLTTPQEVNMDWRPLNPEVGEQFAEILDLWRPDLVHFHAVQRLTASAVEACRAAGVPYLVTVHDAWWISDYQFLIDDRGRLQDPCEPVTLEPPQGVNSGESLARRRVLRDLLGGAEAVLGVSETFAEMYRRCGFGNVLVTPNGLSPIVSAPKVPSASGRLRLAHVGGRSRHKGDHLIEAALRQGRFPHLELTLVDHNQYGGTGRQEVWGETPVRVVGKTPQERMHLFYAEHDVLLAPSLWPESFGLVTREALAAGLWVLASNRGAIAEDVIPGENGWVVDVSSLGELFDAFEEMNAKPSRYMQPPPARRLRSAQQQAEEILAIYDRVLSGPGLEPAATAGRKAQIRFGQDRPRNPHSARTHAG